MAERKVEIVDEDGRITISEEVISTIAQLSAEKVDGIARGSSGAGGGLRNIFGGEDISPIIRTELGDEGVRLELKIAVEYGYPVHEVAQGIQVHVQKDIEELAGVHVAGIDVNVKRVVPPHTHTSIEGEE